MIRLPFAPFLFIYTSLDIENIVLCESSLSNGSETYFRSKWECLVYEKANNTLVIDVGDSPSLFPSERKRERERQGENLIVKNARKRDQRYQVSTRWNKKGVRLLSGRDFVPLCISTRFLAWNSGWRRRAKREKRKSAFCALRKIYGLIREIAQRDPAVALTPLSRRSSPLILPLLFNALIYSAYTRESSSRSERFLLRFPRACTRDIMGRTCANRHTYSRNREYLWGI